MNINVTKSAGVVLKTQGKYCAEDITVVPTLEEKSVTPTESAQEIVPSDGNCGISKVSVGAVQTETKTVAPSASAQTYSPSSGKYFANFTVSAVPSQSKTVTPTKSVQTVNADSGKWLSSVTVNPIPDEFIQPSGSQDITANGTYDVTEKASVNVNVPTASAVEEVATASAMDALLVEANVGKYYKFTGTTDSNYTNGDLYLVEGAVTLINFTINGTAYQAEEGMTWEQWCNSSYNTSNGRYFISNGYLKYTSGYISGPSSTSTSTNPHGTDYPQANGVYTEVSGSGGSAE